MLLVLKCYVMFFLFFCFNLFVGKQNIILYICILSCLSLYFILCRGSRGLRQMIVCCTTTYTVSAYHHKSCEFGFHTFRGVLHTTLWDKVC